LFIHGFNVSFKAAIKRLAQYSTDMKIDGPAIALSWASWGRVFQNFEDKYRRDQKIAKASSVHFALILHDILRILKANYPNLNITILCHSMGNRVFAYGVQELYNATGNQNARPEYHLQFDNIILAAADISVQRFLKNVEYMKKLCKGKLMILSSPDDFALKLSSGDLRKGEFTIYHQKRRIGLSIATEPIKGMKIVYPPIAYEGVEVYIYQEDDFPNVKVSNFHGYFFDIAEIQEHLRLLIGTQTGNPLTFTLTTKTYGIVKPAKKN